MLSKSIKAIAKSVTAILLAFTAVACSSETKQSSNPEPVPVQPVVASVPPAPQAAVPAPAAPIPAVAPPVATVASNTPSVATVFDCVQNDSGYATFARRGERRSSAPLITWNSTEFGSEYPPQKRCEIVSQKLSDKVASNSGRLSDLVLTHGKIQKAASKDGSLTMTVICALNSQEKVCNLNNMLFTLSEANAQNPSKTLVDITNFSKGNATGSTTRESEKLVEKISLDVLVSNILPILPEETPVTKPVNTVPNEAEAKNTNAGGW